MRGYKAVKYIKHVGFFKVSPQSIHIMTMCIYLDMSMYLMVYIFLYSDARYTKHYPPKNHYSPLAWTCH